MDKYDFFVIRHKGKKINVIAFVISCSKNLFR